MYSLVFQVVQTQLGLLYCRRISTHRIFSCALVVLRFTHKIFATCFLCVGFGESKLSKKSRWLCDQWFSSLLDTHGNFCPLALQIEIDGFESISLPSRVWLLGFVLLLLFLFVLSLEIYNQVHTQMNYFFHISNHLCSHSQRNTPYL